MALELPKEAESEVEVDSERDCRDLSRSWLILWTTTAAKVDLPEAGMPATPIKRRLSGEILGDGDGQDSPWASKRKCLLRKMFYGEVSEFSSGGVHYDMMEMIEYEMEMKRKKWEGGTLVEPQPCGVFPHQTSGPREQTRF